MRTNPHILEINTRLWLKRLREKHNQNFTLDTVPLSYWEQYKTLGFDAVWLLGVWQTSAGAQEVARNHPDINKQIADIKPGYSKEDIAASPFAVYDYNVDIDLGGNDSLLLLKKTLNDMGIALFLDFVGNHLAFDHPKTLTNPEYFITTGTSEPYGSQKDAFYKTSAGHYIAHGKDPYFPPWTDTAQINYFSPGAREFMLNTLRHVANMCDGVRCDMAMLSLFKVQRDIWHEYLQGAEYPQEEVIRLALEDIRQTKPEFVFIAEVYWGLEWELQQLGFDYTYDKTLYDRMRFSNAESIKGHLTAEQIFQNHSIRFTANHDEETVIKAFGREKGFAAAALISTITGARMFHLFQLYGRQDRLPIQYMGDEFDDDMSVYGVYEKLLKEVNGPEYHGGQWTLREAGPAGEPHGCKNILCWCWAQANTHKMVVINYSDKENACRLDIKKFDITNAKEAYATYPYEGYIKDWLTNDVVLKPWEVKIITINN